MGGRCFSYLGIEARRIDNAEYLKFVQLVESKVFPLFNKGHSLQCCNQKLNHGDYDGLISEPINTYTSYKDQIKNVLNPSHIHNNGGTFSVLVDNFQLDFTYVSPQFWETSILYFNYDPFANILGRCSRFCNRNLRFGHWGLKYEIYNPDRSVHLDDVILTTNKDEILDFFILNKDKYGKFETEQNIFDYIISSDYFTPLAFDWMELRHEDRIRNRKRPSYCRFLNYIENKNFEKNIIKNHIKEEFLSSYFNININNLYMKALKKYEEDLIIKRKFNGNLVMKITGLRDKQLGNYIKSFKDSICDFKSWVHTSSEEKIIEAIKNFQI